MIRTEKCRGYTDTWTRRVEAVTMTIVFTLLVGMFWFDTVWFGGGAIATMLFGRMLVETRRIHCICNDQDPH